MSSSPKSSNPSNTVKKAVSRGSGKVKKYFNLRREHPEYTKQQCKELSGYSKNTHPDEIEGTKQFQALWQEHQNVVDSLKLDIEERVKAAQKASGFCIKSNLKVLQGIVTNKRNKPITQVKAIKVGTEITGERMPTEVSATLSGDEELLASILSRHTT